MTPTDPARVAAIRNRLEQATPAPWTERTANRVDPGYYSGWHGAGPEHADHWTRGPDGKLISGEPRAWRDAALIANAPADLEWLLSQLDRAEAERDEARAATLRMEHAAQDARASLAAAREALEAIAHWKSDANVCCFPTETMEAAFRRLDAQAEKPGAQGAPELMRREQ